MSAKLANLCLFIFILMPVFMLGTANVLTTKVTARQTAESATPTPTPTLPTTTPTTTNFASSGTTRKITNDLENSENVTQSVEQSALLKTAQPEVRIATTSTATPTTTATTSTTTTPQSLLATEYEQHAHATGNEAKQVYAESSTQRDAEMAHTSINLQQEMGTVAVAQPEEIQQTTTMQTDRLMATKKLASTDMSAKSENAGIAKEFVEHAADITLIYDNRNSNTELPKADNDNQFNGIVTTVGPSVTTTYTNVISSSTNVAELSTDSIALRMLNAEQEEKQREERAEREEREQHEAYQIQETLADRRDSLSGVSMPPSKLNIVDLYPMKIEDFNPIIRDSNEKLIKERTIFTQPDNAAEYRQNLMPNEVEVDGLQQITPQFEQHHTLMKKVNHAIPMPMPTATPTPTPMEIVMATAMPTTTPTLKFTYKEEIIETPQSQQQLSHWETISDFTGKVLAERDGVITEIEQKFRLNDFQTATSELTTATVTDTTAVNPTSAPTSKAEISLRAFVGDTFIDRRVKKSFDFPMHRAASDVMSMPHIDFANTKFNMDNAAGIPAENAPASRSATAMHPEFSTTKFYNSKELYNEMSQHNKRKSMKVTPLKEATSHAKTVDVGEVAAATMETATTTEASNLKLKSSLTDDTSDPIKLYDMSYKPKQATATEADMSRHITLRPTTPTSRVDKTFEATPTERSLLGKTNKPMKYQKELNRAKLLLKAVLPTTNKPPTQLEADMTVGVPSQIIIEKNNNVATTTATTTLNSINAKTITATMITTSATATATTTSDEAMINTAAPAAGGATKTTKSASLLATSTNALFSQQEEQTAEQQQQQHQQQQHQQQQLIQLNERISNAPKPGSKPIARPRILSRLEEKINSLECELPAVPSDSHLWRGNETHELLLPIVTTAHCENSDDCTPEIISWEGEAEIQSGDILIVEINDAILNPSEQNFTISAAHTAQVYQVTRSGHEHCDVTEGILLDITPLVVDGRKLVTLYDKDLTEGVNLLIVVSELWGTQCVRLKVTTKTDNCGENSDCSSKGVCYSNTAMEEYECQCCSGFAGPHCEEIDACNPSPCTNNGICVDLSQGHEGNSYQCLCPYGYTGKNCQYESDPCNPAECMNGGSCVGNSTHFRCDCTAGYTGPLCQHSLNECESSPCVHGICVDQDDGFRCFCQPGFAGEFCNFEYNECESNPCQNGGECIDHIGSYECRCTKGYTGNRCQIKVDFCISKPCPEGQHCIDHGNDFSCVCPDGGNSPDCNQLIRTQCNVNLCTHGGTCWSSGDSFYCACRPGYTGTMCEDEFVLETVVSSSEFIVDDTSARNFNDKTFGSNVVVKSPIELHNAYFAAGVLAAAIFIVAIVVTICHCKVNQTYRKFSTRTTTFFPILGFSRRPKMQSKLNKHWLSGKGLAASGGGIGGGSAATTRHLPQTTNGAQNQSSNNNNANNNIQNTHGLHERPFQRHLAMNLENDMYYTVDFGENSQHSPLIQ